MTIAAEEQSAVPEGRRERKARETRRKILLAAMELFSERDLDAVTVEEIAERADVARGTVFNHFSTKESLCQCMGELQIEALRDALQDGRIPGPLASDKIQQALRLMADYPGEDPERCRVMLTRALASIKPGELPEHRLQWFQLLEGWVLEGQEHGEFRSDVPACELAGFIMGLQLQATLLWALGFGGGTLPDQQSRVLELALDGVKKR